MTMLEVREVSSPADWLRWDAYVGRSPSATLFHASAWRRVVERGLGFEPLYLLATQEGETRGVLPMFHVRSLLFGRALVSVPLGVYGGICADDQEAATALLRHATAIAERLGVRYLELRHRSSHSGDLKRRDLYVTFEREIDPDPERNMARIPQHQRTSIRRGQKSGLHSRVGGVELLGSFYDVYAESVRNLGTPVLSIRVFRSMLAELGDSARVLVVARERDVLAGVLTFFHGDRVMPYYGGAVKAARRYAVNDFMYWELMCHAARRGCRVFDFGRSKRDTGPYHFKRHWGFEPSPLSYEYHLVRDRAVPDTSPLNPKFGLAIEVWKRLPVGVTKAVGPWLARSLT